MKRYGVRVTFWNIDMEYEWERDYIIDFKPTKKWLKSLYDGVNEAENYKILMECDLK